jgi:hypothetical protein
MGNVLNLFISYFFFFCRFFFETGVSERRSVYAVPHGDWFEYVSSPHYLSEIMTYSSFVGFTRGRVVSLWLIFMFVCVTLTHQGSFLKCTLPAAPDSPHASPSNASLVQE